MAELVFDCIGAKAGGQAIAPLLSLVLKVSETTGQRIDAIVLRCQIRIEPAKRMYSAVEAEQLDDLFGDAARWAETLRPLRWATVGVDVPGFTGSTEIDLPILLSLDPQVGSTRYLAGLETGDIPLLLLFGGTVFASSDGKASVQPVPWSKNTSYQLPVQVWRDAIGRARHLSDPLTR